MPRGLFARGMRNDRARKGRAIARDRCHSNEERSERAGERKNMGAIESSSFSHRDGENVDEAPIVPPSH